jgi:1-acyl-sn-glycerol-3-phosphate acyltransferase
MLAPAWMLATFLALGLPVAVLFIPWTILSGDVTALYRAAMAVVRAGVRAGGIRVEVTGLEQVPAGRACLFLCNHVSNLDPLVLLPRIPGRTSVFLKSSLMRIPVLGYGMRLGEFIPVERDGRPDSAAESVRRAAAVMSRGVHVTTFPEGTRSPDARLRPFKKGPFYLAMETQAPCIPVTIYGTEKRMRKGSFRISPGTVRLRFHAPVMPADYADRDALIAAVRESIASTLPESMRPLT